MKNTAELQPMIPTVHALDKRLALVEQSIQNIETSVLEISTTLKTLSKLKDEESGARKMKAYIINGFVTFAMIFSAFELHHYVLR